MKILIAVPTFENIFPDTFKSIYDLDVSGHDVDFEFVRGYDCAKARNRIANMAIDRKADYVLMVDNDVVLPKDALCNLLDGGKEVVFGYCAHRGAGNIYDGMTTVFRLYDDNGNAYFSYPKESMYSGQELKKFCEDGNHKIQVHGAGTSCVIIKTDVFQKIKYPWFKWVEYDKKRQLSEDLYFCSQCKKAKIPMFVDSRVSCGHIFRHTQYTN